MDSHYPFVFGEPSVQDVPYQNDESILCDFLLTKSEDLIDDAADTDSEWSVLNDLYCACSAEMSPSVVSRPIAISKAFAGIYEGNHGQHPISANVILTRVKELFTTNDFDCLVSLSSDAVEMSHGTQCLRSEITSGTIWTLKGYRELLQRTFPSLRHAPGYKTQKCEYVACWTAVVLLLLTTELIETEGGGDEDAHADAFLAMHCDRLVNAPALRGKSYPVLRENLWRTGRFWHWMQRLMPIDNHLKEYLLVASCLEGAGKYHQRAMKNVELGYLSYRYLLEMLRGNYNLEKIGACANKMRAKFHY